MGQKGAKIDLNDALNKQVVLKVKRSKDGQYINLDGANIYAVDDEKVAAVPKNVAALRLISGKNEFADKTAANQNAGKATGNTATGSGTAAGRGSEERR